ncbi:MAG: septal ring lytic transglycosylase RlpA family protein [Acidimicrobiales bacterium]
MPLLLLSSPGSVLSRKLGASARLHRVDARSRREHTRVSASVTPWNTQFALADYAQHADRVADVTTTTSTTLDAVPAVAVRYIPPPTTTTEPPPPPPPPTTTTTAPPRPPAPVDEQTGEASWYWAPAGTCASLHIGLGTEVSVTDLSNGRSTTCTVEDRGPTVPGRIIDLSGQTFSQLAATSTGVIEVRISW